MYVGLFVHWGVWGGEGLGAPSGLEHIWAPPASWSTVLGYVISTEEDVHRHFFNPSLRHMASTRVSSPHRPPPIYRTTDLDVLEMLSGAGVVHLDGIVEDDQGVADEEVRDVAG